MPASERSSEMMPTFADPFQSFWTGSSSIAFLVVFAAIASVECAANLRADQRRIPADDVETPRARQDPRRRCDGLAVVFEPVMRLSGRIASTFGASERRLESSMPRLASLRHDRGQLLRRWLDVARRDIRSPAVSGRLLGARPAPASPTASSMPAATSPHIPMATSQAKRRTAVGERAPLAPAVAIARDEVDPFAVGHPLTLRRVRKSQTFACNHASRPGVDSTAFARETRSTCPAKASGGAEPDIADDVVVSWVSQ